MKTLLFAVNSKHNRFFKRVKEECTFECSIVFTKYLFLPSYKALFHIHKMDFSKPINLKTTDYFARKENSVPTFIIKTFYTLLAYYNYFRYFRKITNKYQQIMFWNGMTFRQAIAFEIAKLYNITPIYIENGLMPNRIVIDKNGVNFNNSVPRNKDFFIKYKNNKSLPNELIPRKPKNAKKFENIKKEPLFKEYVFIPFQLDYDTQIMLFSPWIKNMRMLYHVVENVASNSNIKFIFKEHPSSIKNYPDLHKKANNNPNIMFANAYATQELIEKSNAVITMNSTVGIESLLLGKKVITLANAFYNIKDIVYHCENEQELENTVKNLPSIPRDEELITNFLKYLYYDYLIEGNFKDFKCDFKKIQDIIE